MPTRTFTRDELDSLHVTAGGSTVVSDEIVHQKRWSVVHEIVFRAPDDLRLWSVTYFEPATEAQECDPWGYHFGDDNEPVEAVEVEPYLAEVTRYRLVVESV